METLALSSAQRTEIFNVLGSNITFDEFFKILLQDLQGEWSGAFAEQKDTIPRNTDHDLGDKTRRKRENENVTVDDDNVSTTLGDIPNTTTDPTTKENDNTLSQPENDEVFQNLPTRPDNAVQTIWEDDRINPFNVRIHPLYFLAPLIKKFYNVLNYVTHPNVALTPIFFLSKLKQRIYEHVRDRINGYNNMFQDYPFAYRKH